MDDSMKQIVSYIETHNTKQNEKIQKLQQANQEQHKIIMFLQDKVREKEARIAELEKKDPSPTKQMEQVQELEAQIANQKANDKMILGWAKQISDIQKQELQGKLDLLHARLKEEQQRADQAE